MRRGIKTRASGQKRSSTRDMSGVLRLDACLRLWLSDKTETPEACTLDANQNSNMNRAVASGRKPGKPHEIDRTER